MQSQRRLSENGTRVLEAAVRRLDSAPAGASASGRGNTWDNGWDNWNQWNDGDWGNGVQAPWQN
jgi:hypothetical protein